MMKAVLKTLALSFGGGLALGAGLRLTQAPQKERKEPGVDLDPLLHRLKSVESRIVQMESRAPLEHIPAVAPAIGPIVEKTLAAFESRLNRQLAGEVEQLRGEIRQVDHRLLELDSQLPVVVQSTVDLRFVEVERKLQGEFEETQIRSMEAFVAALQSKVVERISTLETNLAGQSEAIGKLRDTSLKTDENLQKMLAGIERLVSQSRPSPHPPPGADSAPAPPPAAAEASREPVAQPSAARQEFIVKIGHICVPMTDYHDVREETLAAG